MGHLLKKCLFACLFVYFGDQFMTRKLKTGGTVWRGGRKWV